MRLLAIKKGFPNVLIELIVITLPSKSKIFNFLNLLIPMKSTVFL